MMQEKYIFLSSKKIAGGPDSVPRVAPPAKTDQSFTQTLEKSILWATLRAEYKEVREMGTLLIKSKSHS